MIRLTCLAVARNKFPHAQNQSFSVLNAAHEIFRRDIRREGIRIVFLGRPKSLREVFKRSQQCCSVALMCSAKVPVHTQTCFGFKRFDHDVATAKTLSL